MDLSGVYSVCLMFSLLWETQIVHNKFGNNIEKKLIKKYYFNNLSDGSEGSWIMGTQMYDCTLTYEKMTVRENEKMTDFLLLSTT